MFIHSGKPITEYGKHGPECTMWGKNHAPNFKIWERTLSTKFRQVFEVNRMSCRSLSKAEIISQLLHVFFTGECWPDHGGLRGHSLKILKHEDFRGNSDACTMRERSHASCRTLLGSNFQVWQSHFSHFITERKKKEERLSCGPVYDFRQFSDFVVVIFHRVSFIMHESFLFFPKLRPRRFSWRIKKLKLKNFRLLKWAHFLNYFFDFAKMQYNSIANLFFNKDGILVSCFMSFNPFIVKTLNIPPTG